MERLTFEGNFCEIARCKEVKCPYDTNCSQKQVLERLKAYEDTGIEPEAVETVKLALCAKHMDSGLNQSKYGTGGMTMAEKRLIDANAMRDDWPENGENEYVYDTNAVLDSIDSQPTVDAVEVVRCKDCIRRYDTDECPMCFLIEGNYCDYTNENGYCDRGERKEGADNGR